MFSGMWAQNFQIELTNLQRNILSQFLEVREKGYFPFGVWAKKKLTGVIKTNCNLSTQGNFLREKRFQTAFLFFFLKKEQKNHWMEQSKLLSTCAE